MVRAIQVLTKSEIIEINRRMTSKFGGIFFECNQNLVNPGSLEHVLEEIQGNLFGLEPYPTLIEKAAAICWRIIVNHVFNDGNKRTGMETCRLFLELNGYAMRIDFEVVDIALSMANNRIRFEEFVRWVEQRTSKIPV
ncbi:MAG: type II toxin-antitoxin system death-on-curing family toxin [Thermodesulfobacteriota bacterium]|nr:type II toxin-antitoxin system death-on-curing family toxin [Thermodesulfobacteriota bacterium]